MKVLILMFLIVFNALKNILTVMLIEVLLLVKGKIGKMKQMTVHVYLVSKKTHLPLTVLKLRPL